MRVIILVKLTYGNEACDWTQFSVYHLDGFIHGVCIGNVAFVGLEERLRNGTLYRAICSKKRTNLCFDPEIFADLLYYRFSIL